MRYVRCLVARQDAGEHEPADADLRGRVDQIEVAAPIRLDGVARRVRCVAGRGRDYGVDAVDGAEQRLWVKQVARGKLDPCVDEWRRLRCRPDKRANPLAANDESFDDLAPKHSGATHDQNERIRQGTTSVPTGSHWLTSHRLE